MIIARISRGIWSHMGVRFEEWKGMALLAGFGVVLHVEPVVLEGVVSYNQLLRWWPEDTWTVMFLAVAVLRMFALGINGTFKSFPHSPLIRIVAAWFASITWLSFAWGMWLAYVNDGGSPLAWMVYLGAAVSEMRNVYCARLDMIANTKAR